MSEFNSQFKIVSIDGNIGSGKSTLLEELEKKYINNPNIIFLKEPVDEWSEIKDENEITILEKFYKDQKKYSFSFQMMAYISRLALLKSTIQANPNAIIITERSLFTDKMVFAKMLYDSGDIELVNYKIYLKWFDTFVEEYPLYKVIYIKTIPEICFERISKRSRTGESSIPLEYLINCDKYHDNMLCLNSLDYMCTNQLLINGNIDIYENADYLNTCLNEIGNFIC
jgi:deoxyadenosine/deoxycytidine kinase